MIYKGLIINLLFGATFFNHLHALSFIPQHNRPLLLLLFPLVIIYVIRYNTKFNINNILWFCGFFVLIIVSLVYNILFGVLDIYYPEVINRTISYLVVFYFFLIGTLFKIEREVISNYFYTFLIFIGILQIYTMFGYPGYPGTSFIGNIFDNHLIHSFINPRGYVLFLEAEPSYVAYLILFVMVIYENKRIYPWLILSFLTFSVRTTFIAIAYFFKKKPILYGFSIVLLSSFIISSLNISYPVYYRIKALITFQTLDPSSYIRVVKNKATIDIIKDYPIIGVGAGQWSSYFTSDYLPNYDTRGIRLLDNKLKQKSKFEEPHSFLLGLCSENGIIGLSWVLLGFYFLFKHSHRKYLFGLILLILIWDYPYGKPFIWLLLGYIYQENIDNKKKKMLFVGV